jgi:hypothetical protein
MFYAYHIDSIMGKYIFMGVPIRPNGLFSGRMVLALR